MTTLAATAERCRWEARGGSLICTTHQQLGQRVGLGKLYRVVTTEGTQLVRAPDPGEAKRAANGLRVERALPHEADGADVLDTRKLIHRKPIPPTRSAQPRPWAEPPPPQFAGPSMPIECSLSGWEQFDIASSSVWERGLARIREIFTKTPGVDTPRAR